MLVLCQNCLQPMLADELDDTKGAPTLCAHCRPSSPPPEGPVDPQPRAAAPAGDVEAPPVGTVVHYTLGHGPRAGETRPAIVLRVPVAGDEQRVPHLLARFDRERLAALVQLGRVPASPPPRLVVVVRVLTDQEHDGLPDHTVLAAYSATPLAWHYTPIGGAR